MPEKIIITDGYTLNPGDLSWEGLQLLGEVVNYDRTSPQEVIDRCKDATVIVTNKTPINAETINACKGLKLIAVTATGYNIVDVEAAKQRNIPVCNVPGYGTDSVAQHTFALILELANHVGVNTAHVHHGGWVSSPDFSYSVKPIIELAGKTLGLIGYGDIGKKVAEIARAFGMKVIYSRKSGVDPNAISIEEVFRNSDIVSLHCPLTPDNAGFVNRSLLSQMKPQSFLINTARGQLINESDLADALKEGKIRAAAVDVLSTEPPPKSNPLLSAPNCVVTPHNAWLSFEARARIMKTTIENVRKALAGEPGNVVGR